MLWSLKIVSKPYQNTHGSARPMWPIAESLQSIKRNLPETWPSYRRNLTEPARNLSFHERNTTGDAQALARFRKTEQTRTVALLLAEPDGTATEPPRNHHGTATTSRPNGFSVKSINMNCRGTAPEPPRNRHGTATRSRPNAFSVQSRQPEPPGTAHGTATKFAKGSHQMHFPLKSHQPEPRGTALGTA